MFKVLENLDRLIWFVDHEDQPCLFICYHVLKSRILYRSQIPGRPRVFNLHTRPDPTPFPTVMLRHHTPAASVILKFEIIFIIFLNITGLYRTIITKSSWVCRVIQIFDRLQKKIIIIVLLFIEGVGGWADRGLVTVVPRGIFRRKS